MKPESVFRQNRVRPFLKKLKNSWFTSVQQQAILGTPDFLICIHGKFIGLELKARGGKVTALQAHILSQIEKAGGLAIVADPDNWQVVSERLLKLDRGESNE